MPTEYFKTRAEAEAFAATVVGAWVAPIAGGAGWKVVWPG